ncbi:MAG: helix-turn-helix domain containing protein [Rhizonema sp. PD37]|nr:helix-turn-helix domain containing protein [Rhizonema sp. PD37]
MNNFLLKQQQKTGRVAILTTCIRSYPEVRKLKRAIAVEMTLQREPHFKSTKLLDINKSCIANWKQRFEAEEIDGMKL